MNCVIFQKKVEIDYFLKKFNISNFKIIAWNSEVVDELDKLNLDYICAGSIYKKKFNVNERINLIKKYGKINNLLDEIILKNIPIFKRNNIRPFNSIASLNRNFFLSYIMDIDIIFNLKKNFNFKKVFYFEYLVEGYSGLLSKIIKLYDNKKQGYFQKLKINFENKNFFNENYVKLSLESKVQTNFLNIFFKNIKMISKRILKGDDLKNHAYTFFTSILNIRNKKENILAYTNFKNFDKYKKALNNKNLNLIYWENLFFKIKKKNINFNLNRINKYMNDSKVLKKCY